MDTPRTMLQQLTQPQDTPEEVVFIQRFRYETYFDPNAQVFTIAIVLPSGKRYHLPMERLNFGQFARDIAKSLEAVQNSSEISGNGSGT